MPKKKENPAGKPPLHVSLVAIPDVLVSPLLGLYDVLQCVDRLGTFDEAAAPQNPFQPEIVALSHVPTNTASGVLLPVHRTIETVPRTDIVIIPSMMVQGSEWQPGRYPRMVQWLRAMHEQGAVLCSACTGVLLLAETGLLDGREATIHWAYARTFHSNFPNVHLRLEKVLIVTGDRQQFVMSGASASWHDLVLYLIARHVGPRSAQSIAKFMLLQWHADGQAPYIAFEAPTDHGDATILDAQRWLEPHFSVARPVEQMARRSGLAERSFIRRFTQATGHSPIAYVQHLRVEEAKRRLERSDTSIEEISWAVGYEDPAFFRRVFKRITGITPGAYRRKFRLPEFARPGISAGPTWRDRARLRTG